MLLGVKGTGKSFGTAKALDDVTVEVEDGAVIAPPAVSLYHRA